MVDEKCMRRAQQRIVFSPIDSYKRIAKRLLKLIYFEKFIPPNATAYSTDGMCKQTVTFVANKFDIKDRGAHGDLNPSDFTD